MVTERETEARVEVNWFKWWLLSMVGSRKRIICRNHALAFMTEDACYIVSSSFPCPALGPSHKSSLKSSVLITDLPHHDSIILVNGPLLMAWHMPGDPSRGGFGLTFQKLPAFLTPGTLQFSSLMKCPLIHEINMLWTHVLSIVYCAGCWKDQDEKGIVCVFEEFLLFWQKNHEMVETVYMTFWSIGKRWLIYFGKEAGLRASYKKLIM